MGIVYRATQLSLNRVVALKILAAELSDDSGFRARFQREGQLQAQLDHQHIVTVYEAGQTEQGLFLAMRLIDGPTLKDLILASKLDPRRSLRILAQVAQALDEAHEAGLIHRDIKPQNILVDKGDHAYLADFGLIKAPDDAEGLTGTGQFIGTIDYVAPEQIQGEPATAASDCYALAGVLCECLTGDVPFPRNNEAATLHAHILEPPPRLTERVPGLPPAIDEVIAAGMAKDPAARPSPVALIRAATLAFASPTPSLGAPPTRIAPGLGSDGNRKTTRVPVITGALATPAVPTAAAAAATRPVAAPGAVAAPAPRGEPFRAPAAPSRFGGRAVTIVAVLVAAAVAIAAGLLVGNSSSSTASTPFDNTDSSGHLQLHYPSGWQLSSTVPALPGISFEGTPITLAWTAGGGGLTAGETAAGGATLLPASFRAQVLGGLAPSEPVSLGDIDAYQYSGLHVRGLGGTVTAYVVPTSAGVATIACWASSTAPPSVLRDCSQVAATLRLLGATADPLSPSATYAQALSATFARLHTAIQGPLARLGAATAPAGQASAAQQLAGAYTQAADNLGGVTVSPLLQDAQPAIVGALRQLAAGYSQAAAAAGSNSSASYRRAGTQIAAGSAALSGALQGLATLGYSVGH
jgi:hypothetical protein